MTENELLNGTVAAGAPSTSKKRRNRKKKGKKKDTDASDDAPADAAPAPGAAVASAAAAGAPDTATVREKQLAKLDADKLNPHAQLCAKVMRGANDITLEQVEAALEEMWDLQLPYDDPEAVVKYIKSDGAAARGTVADSGDVTPTTSNGHAAATNGHANGAAPVSAEVTDMSQVDDGEEPAPKAPMSMADKLDMVADFESLPDAVFALSEWVNKAAKLQELEEVCAAKKTVALPTIVRRAIAECNDDQEFDSVIMPEMLRLVGGILEQCGVAVTAVAGTRNALKSSLQRARKAIAVAEESEEPVFSNFADRLARFIVSRIAAAVDETKFSAGDVGAMQRLEREIDALASKNSSNGARHSDDNLVNMLAKRHIQNTAAKKSSLVAKIALNGLGNVDGNDSSNNSETARESQINKADISMAILGPEGKQRVDLRKAELEALQSQVRDGEPEDVQTLRSSISEYQTEREAIAARIADMRASIDKLESLDMELRGKIDNLEMQIKEDISNRTNQAEAFNKRLDGAVAKAKFGKTIHGLVDILKSYDDALEQAIGQPSTVAVETFAAADNVGEIVSNKMDMFLFRARNYFVTEAECVDFLQARIETTQREIGDLKIEIEECQGLGMTTTVGQMEEDLKQKEDQIASDTNQVQEMCDDASNMFDSLLSRLSRYNAAAQAENLAPIHASALQGIPSCISRLGIPNGERLNSSVAGDTSGEITHSPPKPQRAPVDTFALSSAIPDAPTNVTPIAPPPPLMPAMTEQSKTMPKFTWAASAPATGKQSLLDIQREELQSKDE